MQFSMAYVCLFYINVFVCFLESEIRELETNRQLDEVHSADHCSQDWGSTAGQIRPGSFYRVVYGHLGIIFTWSPALHLAERLPHRRIIQSFKKNAEKSV